jgi:homoserine O-acetyltransferase
MFGNGVSSSPSTHPRYRSGQPFPRISGYDNVVQQGKLLFEHLGARQIALACGWSVGGMQAYQWAALFPDRVRRLLPFGSAARPCAYNQVFLEGLKASLLADGNWRGSGYERQPEKGLRAFARVYAGWAYSDEFFRGQLYRELGYETIEQLLICWEEEHLRLDARDLLATLRTWQCTDVDAGGRAEGGASALGTIQARTLLVTCSTDRYFPAVDNIAEAALIADCQVRVLQSPFGHCALSPGRMPAAMTFLNRCLEEIFAA